MKAQDNRNKAPCETNWDETQRELAIAHIPWVRYIPNPRASVIDKARPTITLTEKDILPIRETYDWSSIPSKHYIHIIVLHGSFVKEKLGKLYVQGYRGVAQKPKGDFFLGYLRKPEGRVFLNHRFYKGQWGFRIEVREDRWRDRKTKQERKKFVGQVTLYPRFRADMWEIERWAESLIGIIEQAFFSRPLRLRRIEMPIDFSLTGYHRKSLELCFWMKYSDAAWLNNKDGKVRLLYHGRNKKAKSAAAYRKKDSLHVEVRWRGRAFSAKPEYTYLSLFSMLLFLLDTYESTDFRYLDIFRLARCRNFGTRALNYWQMFKDRGIRATLDSIKQFEKYKNIQKLTKPHPFNPVYKLRTALTIREGFRLALEKTGCGTFADANTNWTAILEGKKFPKTVKTKLAEYASRCRILGQMG